MEDAGKLTNLAQLFLMIVSLFSPILAKYQMSEIEILPNPSGEGAKIFTAEEISRYDGSDVSTL
jgi:hypothetical protein